MLQEKLKKGKKKLLGRTIRRAGPRQGGHSPSEKILYKKEKRGVGAKPSKIREEKG